MIIKIVYSLGKTIFRHAHLLILGPLLFFYLFAGGEAVAMFLMFIIYFNEYVCERVEEFEKKQKLGLKKKVVVLGGVYAGLILVLLLLYLSYPFVYSETMRNIAAMYVIIAIISKISLKHYGINKSVLFLH